MRLILLALLAGCGSKNERGLSLRPVEVSQFAGGEIKPATASGENKDENQSPRPVKLGAGAPDVEAAAPASAPPDDSSSPATQRLAQPGDAVFIDSVVGQVSGRPIFADELLEPLEDELRAESRRLSPAEFTQRAAQIVADRLNQVVLTELFLAEAEASLTPQQQQGLLAFLREFQEKTVSSGQGSRTLTEQRLMDELGLTIEEYTEQEKKILLIGTQINRKIAPRVIVSWKDIEREYERRKAEFNPPGSVILKRIRLSNTNQQEQIEQVKALLTANAPFEKVAEAAGADAVSALPTLAMGPGGITDIELNETFRAPLAGLTVGQTTGPIETEGYTTWLHVAAIDQPPPRDLYQVQRQLMEELQHRRETEERGRYIQSLFERGIHDEINEMSRRVLAVALLRYGR